MKKISATIVSAWWILKKMLVNIFTLPSDLDLHSLQNKLFYLTEIGSSTLSVKLFYPMRFIN